MRNVLFDQQGRMWIIDHDMGNVTSSSLRQAGSIPYTNDPKILSRRRSRFLKAKFPSLRTRCWQILEGPLYGPQMVKHPLYGRMSRFDQLIHYQDMAPTVEKIQSLNSTIQDDSWKLDSAKGRAKAIIERIGKAP
ncbi:MAG: hypothetical protein R3B83_05970 [Nitrospirales bacterium]|nr:hypothetical protein [Nitrospirales bacterium]